MRWWSAEASRQFDGGVPVPLISTPEDWQSAWRVLKNQQKGQDWHMTRSLNFTVGQPPRYWITADPRELWPRESDFVWWLADNPGLLAACLGLRGLEVTGQEVVTGYQRAEANVLGRPGWRGGLRMDLIARDADDQVIVVEAQFDESDHAHLGKLVTYAREVRADVAVWAIAGLDPVWGEDLEVLAELNRLFAGHRRFCAVAVMLESRLGQIPGQEAPLAPRLRRVDLASVVSGMGFGDIATDGAPGEVASFLSCASRRRRETLSCPPAQAVAATACW